MKFAADSLINWYYKKIKSKNLEIDILQKIKYELYHLISWEKDTCCICNFPLKINIKGLEACASEMSYTGFYIRKENKFLRNIFPEEDLLKPQTLKDLPTYRDSFQKFLKTIIHMEAAINDLTEFSEIFNDDVRVFCKENCTEFSNFDELTAEIKENEN